MPTCCVIGNGRSRIDLDLHQINSVMTTIGCNALYRDFMPNHITAVDYSMLNELVVVNKIYTQCTVWTEERANYQLITPHVTYVHTGYPSTLDSGNLALVVAGKLLHDIVYMIGFDYSIVTTEDGDKKNNNVYRDTFNYQNSNYIAGVLDLTKQWTNRLRYIVKKFPNTKYIRVNGNDYSCKISESNYSEISMLEFNKLLKEIK